MPAVATRRSTRAFVRKSVGKAATTTTRVLRSGKRLSLSKSPEDGSPRGWMQWWKETPLKKEVVEEEEELGNRLNKEGEEEEGEIALNREEGEEEQGEKAFNKEEEGDEEQRKTASNREEEGKTALNIVVKKEFGDFSLPVERFGVCYCRKRRRSELPRAIGLTGYWNLILESLSYERRRKRRRLFLPDDSRKRFLGRFSEEVLVSSTNPEALILLVESSRSSSLGIFCSLFVSILAGMTAGKIDLSEITPILSSIPAVYWLPLNNIYFLPLKTWNRDFYVRIASSGSGFCLLFRSWRLSPLISVNFSALPFLFNLWHSRLFYRQLYLPVNTSYTSAEEHRLSEYQSKPKIIPSSIMQDLVSRSFLRSGAFKFRTRGRKRSLLRNGPFIRSRRSKFSKADAGTKIYPIQESLFPLNVPGVIQKRKRFTKRSSSVDGLTCAADILIIEADHCRRETGAKIGLELSDSDEWRLVVRLNDSVKFSHKAEEMAGSSWNKFNKAFIWAGDNGWKLEFCSKYDWGVFKELHKECMERNFEGVRPRVVPVPGVREISDYEESCSSGFVRPESYIRAGKDEVGRMIGSESAVYDMDSGDEEWIQGAGSSVSREEFERVISALEKAAFEHPDGVSDQEKMAAICGHRGSDFFGLVYDYWVKKRRRKHAALVKVFQVQPSRKKQQQQQQDQKPNIRKKRSFKRQVSHLGRGNADTFFEAATEQEAVQKYLTATAAIEGYVATATKARSRAQELMLNAELAAYKATVAVQLANAMREGATYPSSP